jgi:peptidoglycan/xylan/chitin deacetylase (PgdA/CDA1 family)
MSKHVPTLLIGYDVESSTDSDTVRRFLTKVEEIHRDLSVPATFFLVGKVVENNSQELVDLGRRCELFDYQQHTYSHMLLKTVCMDDGKKVTIVKAGSVEQVDDEVAHANRVLKEKLGVEGCGLTGPWGYYRGLSDRPDLLEILKRNGIGFARTWARDQNDYQPVSFDIQPFWYEPQGYPDILEFAIHGWQDVHWRNVYGWENLDGYLGMLRETVDMVASRGIVWSYGTHDWSSLRSDPEMSIMKGLMEHALNQGLRIVDYKTYYLEAISAKGSAPGP